MKQELTDQLIKNYPRVFAKLKSVDTNDGWFLLIDNLCAVIESHLARLPEEMRDQIYAAQLKEKFGSLRAYFSHETPFMDGAIHLAEGLSNTICEDCGNVGTSHTIGHWMATLCETHYQERKQKREAMQRKINDHEPQ